MRYVPYNYIDYVVPGGRQFKVTSNDLIVVNRIAADIGEEIYLDKVNNNIVVGW